MGVLTEEAGLSLLACEEGCDPIEDRLRGSIRTTIEAVVEEELDTFPGRLKSSRSQGPVKGSPWWSPGAAHQHPGGPGGEVPRARLLDGEGVGREWCSKALGRYQRRTRRAEDLTPSAGLAGVNRWRVKRALCPLFQEAVSKEVVSCAAVR